MNKISGVNLKIKCSETLGIRILFTGIVLIFFVFLISAIHLYGIVNILASLNILSSFGGAISPFIETIIGILFLAVLAWIATMVLNKGQTIVVNAKLLDKNNTKFEE